MAGITEALSTRDDVAAALIDSLTAEAESHRAEAKFHSSEAEWRNLQIQGETLDLERAVDQRQREKVNDYYLRVYPFTTGVTEASVKACISQLNVWHRLSLNEPIEIIFSSPGGSVVDGIALYDHIKYLRAQGTTINTTCLGMAASMAGILLQAGEVRTIGAESWLMIHEVSFGAGGKIGEVEDTTAWVKAVQKRVLNIFADRSKMTVKQLDTKWRRKDWWIDSDEALSLGLVDEVR